MRGVRALLAAGLLAPLLAHADPTLLDRIDEMGEQSRFVPDKALVQLLQVEPEARAADILTKAEFLTQLALTRGRLGQNDVALTLAAELVAYGTAVHSKAALAKGLLCEAYIKFALADVASAHRLAFEAEPLAEASGLEALRVQATITAGEAYAEQGNFPAAMVKLQRAVDMARPLENQLVLASALKSLAVLYDQVKEYEKGFAVLDELLDVARKLQSPGRLALAKNTEYALSIDSKQPKRALRALEEGLVLERQLGAQRMIANTLVNLSDSYLQQHDYARTLQYANQSLKVAQQSNDGVIEATANINIGEAYLGMGRIAEGKRSFETGMAFYEKANSQPDLQALLVEYGQALERAGDLAGALAAYHRERDISNQMFEKQRRQSVLELQEKYEAEKKQRQIELLSRENQVKSAEIDNRRLQQRIWWLLALVLAMASVIVGMLYRKVRHANVQLNVKNQELKRQSSRDPLTALYNRRHFQEFMRQHGSHAGKLVPRQSMADTDAEIVGALFLLDVDHFKQINDHYGHAAGDLVLTTIAETLHDVLRETDMIVRWGGEEFLAFLPAVTRGGLDDIALRILNGVAAQTVHYQGQAISVHVSVGFAPYPLAPLGQALSWERSVNLVDMALYLAKAHGRNRAYGLRHFQRMEGTTMEVVEQDLERAWRDGYVDLSVVLGGQDEAQTVKTAAASAETLEGNAAAA